MTSVILVAIVSAVSTWTIWIIVRVTRRRRDRFRDRVSATWMQQHTGDRQK